MPCVSQFPQTLLRTRRLSAALCLFLPTTEHLMTPEVPLHWMESFLSVGRNRGIWNSRLVVDSYSVGRELHCSALKHKEDSADGGDAINRSAPRVDVKALIAVLADRGHHMVTGGGQLVESPIKGLPVIVSPSCAHSFTVGCITCKNIILLIYICIYIYIY